MVKVNSSRAKKILETPRFLKNEITLSMRRFPGDQIILWMDLEGSAHSVKNLSFSGSLENGQILLLESMASLLVGKNISVLETLTVRECEAYLRDRNSEMAFEGMSSEEETLIMSVFRWIRLWPFKNPTEVYSFAKEKGPFRLLRLADKVRELKAFLASADVTSLYLGQRHPELIDVEELTVYVDAPYASEEERTLFQELHERGAGIFREEELNFIPEA